MLRNNACLGSCIARVTSLEPSPDASFISASLFSFPMIYFWLILSAIKPIMEPTFTMHWVTVRYSYKTVVFHNTEWWECGDQWAWQKASSLAGESWTLGLFLRSEQSPVVCSTLVCLSFVIWVGFSVLKRQECKLAPNGFPLDVSIGLVVCKFWFCRRSCTQSAFPQHAAIPSGVLPVLSALLTSAFPSAEYGSPSLQPSGNSVGGPSHSRRVHDN